MREKKKSRQPERRYFDALRWIYAECLSENTNIAAIRDRSAAALKYPPYQHRRRVPEPR